MLHAVSPTSVPTAQAQILREDVAPEELVPGTQAHRIDNLSFSPPTAQSRCLQVLGDNPFHPQQNHFGEDECPYCSQIWLTHCECIFETSIGTQNCREVYNCQHQLHTSFQELKKHIQEHWVASGTSCCLCQNHFSHHLLDLQLLSKVNSEDPRHWQIRMDLRQGVFALRKHVRDRHMDYELRRG